jgi:ribonucleoside-diphosphate reductase alpha chain
MIKTITKRDGTKEPFCPVKLNKWAEWACSGLNVSWADIAGKAIVDLPEEISSQRLQDALISAAESLIYADPEFDVPAKRLFLAQLRKMVHGQYTPPNLLVYAKKMEKLGKWLPFSKVYTLDEMCAFMAAIDHTRDDLFTYGGLKQCADKYLQVDTNTNTILETPQFLYMGMCMATGISKSGSRNDWTISEIIDLYHEFSLQRVNVPTPPLVGLRTHDRGFASCCLIAAGDSIKSLDAANSAVFMMTAARAGIGYIGLTRSTGDSVRGGSFKHTGKLPFYRAVDRLTKALTQQSRGGSATVFYPFFDPEIVDLINLKSQRVSEDKRIEFLDYTLQDNEVLSELYHKNMPVKLISLADNPELYDAFYSDNLSKFRKLYAKATSKETVPARELVHNFLIRRAETGRMYWQDVHNSNVASLFKDPIRQSNLCLEILQPTTPFVDQLGLYNTSPEVTNGEISLCNLGGAVFGRITDWDKSMYLLVKFIDTIIDLQDIPFPAVEVMSKARRNIAIGVINLAGYLAENGFSYGGQEARDLINRTCEQMLYSIMKASVRLAKERGACGMFDRTKMADGILPIDLINKNTNELVSDRPLLDWEALRQDVLIHGTRNSTFTACMPGESSSVLLGATNGVEPIKQLVSAKKSGKNIIVSVAPKATEFTSLSSYEMAADIDQDEHIKMMAVIQRWTTQAISTNNNYRYSDYPEEKIPMKVLLRHWSMARYYGLKTLYYCNTDTGSISASMADSACSGGGCTL